MLAGFLALLELRNPYYFLQDDNRTAYLPQLVAHWRGLRAGELPLYNFHQFRGVPALALGPVLLFYPPAYAALLLSQLLWGHPFATMDLLVAGHLAVGLLGMQRLLRRLGLPPSAVAFGALTWPLSSMAVYTASSWWSVAGVVAYLPWTIHLALLLIQRPSARLLVALVAVRTLFLYAGHVQFFVYATCFELLCVLLAARAAAVGGWRPLARAVGPYLLTLYLSAALTLPFVQTLWHHVERSSERAGPLSYSTFRYGSYNLLEWAAGTVDPYRARAGSDEPYPHLSFTGHVSVLLLVIAPLLLRRSPPTTVPPRAFALPLGVAFLWTVGALDRVIYLLPVLNRFRWHFRLNVVVVFFMIVVAAMAFAAARRALGRRYGDPAARAAVAVALLVQLGGLAVLYGTQPQRAFSPVLERPPLREPLAAMLASGRLVALGFHAGDPFSAAQLAYDYASLWGLFQYGGYRHPQLPAVYDQRVFDLSREDERRPQHDGVFKPSALPFEHFAEWAVAWYVVAKNGARPAETERYRQLLGDRGMTVAAEDGRRIVFHDPRAKPLVALVDGRARLALSPRLGGRSLAVRVPPSAHPRQLVAAFFAHPGLTAWTATGRRLVLHHDPLGRLVVTVPPRVDGVRFVYDEPTLRNGARNAALLLLLAVPLLWWWLPRRERTGT